jgi:hypothetical protein
MALGALPTAAVEVAIRHDAGSGGRVDAGYRKPANFDWRVILGRRA